MAIKQPNTEMGSAVQQFKTTGEEFVRQIASLLQAEEAMPEREALAISATIVPLLEQEIVSAKDTEKTSVWESVKKVTRFELLKRQKRMNQNFGLSEMAFNQMVVALQQGDDSLFERIFLKHFEDCVRFIVRHYKAEWQDAYDASMECLLEFHKRLRNGKISYGNLRFLFTRMAGQIYLKWIKKTSQNEPMAADFDIEEEPETIDSDTLDELNMAWQKMCEDCQQVLKSFYYDGIPLKDYAALHDKTPAAVRKQKQRCVEKLRNFFMKQQ